MLHELDDGPSTLPDAIALARAAELGGVQKSVATPHIREDYPFPIDLVEGRMAELGEALSAEGIALALEIGGEVAISQVDELDDDALRRLCLGSGSYLLVESPYSHATGLLEGALFELQVRGFRPVLAHPERSPGFLAEPGRLEALVKRGILCSITASSLEGRFGGRVLRFAAQLLDGGLVHNLASDAHDARRRPPLNRAALESLESKLPALRERGAWLTEQVPAALLAGEDVPPPPSGNQRGARRRSLFRRG
jgi:protein-tyrosine phosphatase